MPFSTFFPDAQPQNNPEYARLLLYLLVFLTLKMKNVHYSCSTPPDRVPLVFNLLFLERIKFWRPSFLQNCANRRFRKVMIKTSFQLFLLRKTVQKLAWKSLLSKKLLTCSSGEPISSPRGGGGISEKAHSNFECWKILKKLENFWNFFKNRWKSTSRRSIFQLQNYYEPSQKYPRIFGSPNMPLFLTGFLQK